MQTTTSNPAQVFADSNADVLREAGRETDSRPRTGSADRGRCGTSSREYGDTGYGIVPLLGDRSGALWGVHAGDGSHFRLWTDRYGNVGRVPDLRRDGLPRTSLRSRTLGASPHAPLASNPPQADCGCGWGDLCGAHPFVGLLRCDAHEENVTRHGRSPRPIGAVDAQDDTGKVHGPWRPY